MNILLVLNVSILLVQWYHCLSPMDKLVQLEYENIDTLSKYIDYQSAVTESIKNLLSNATLYRFDTMYQEIVGSDQYIDRVLANITRLNVSSNARDIFIKRLSNLQSVYNVSAIDIAYNNITISKSSNQNRLILNSKICYNIGVSKYMNNQYDGAIEWLKVSKNMNKNDGLMNEIFILDVLEAAYLWNKNIFQALETHIAISNISKSTETSESNRIGYESLLEYNLSTQGDVFKKICLEGDQRSVLELSKLSCHYLDTSDKNPMIRLHKVKVEQVHESPDILLYHDTLSNIEMEYLISDTIKDMSRAWDSNSYSIDRHRDMEGKRHGKEYFIGSDGRDQNRTILRTIARRLGAYTGLESEDRMLTFNYGLVGYKQIHYDSMISVKADHSDVRNWNTRILATSYVYLTNVQVGGETIFNILGVSVKPVKGSLLVFRNMDKYGHSDPLSKHAACPVIVGSKWTLLTGFRIGGNEFIAPCPVVSNQA